MWAIPRRVCPDHHARTLSMVPEARAARRVTTGRTVTRRRPRRRRTVPNGRARQRTWCAGRAAMRDSRRISLTSEATVSLSAWTIFDPGRMPLQKPAASTPGPNWAKFGSASTVAGSACSSACTGRRWRRVLVTAGGAPRLDVLAPLDRSITKNFERVEHMCSVANGTRRTALEKRAVRALLIHRFFQ